MDEQSTYAWKSCLFLISSNPDNLPPCHPKPGDQPHGPHASLPVRHETRQAPSQIRRSLAVIAPILVLSGVEFPCATVRSCLILPAPSCSPRGSTMQCIAVSILRYLISVPRSIPQAMNDGRGSPRFSACLGALEPVKEIARKYICTPSNLTFFLAGNHGLCDMMSHCRLTRRACRVCAVVTAWKVELRCA